MDIPGQTNSFSISLDVVTWQRCSQSTLVVPLGLLIHHSQECTYVTLCSRVFSIKKLISKIILKEKVGQQAWASKSKFKIFDNLIICIFFCFHLYGAQYKPSPVLMRSNLTPVHCDIPWFLFVQQFLVAAHSANTRELLQYLLHTL